MISVSDLKDALRVTRSDEDAYIADLEEAAVAVAENETGRYFGPEQQTTEWLRGHGHPRLHLAEEPSGTITSVDQRIYPGGTATTITATEDNGYVQRGRQLIRKAGLVWHDGYEYEVSYKEGYTSGAEPDEIRQAVRGLVVHWYENRLPVDEAKQVVPMHVRNILAGYSGRRMRV